MTAKKPSHRAKKHLKRILEFVAKASLLTLLLFTEAKLSVELGRLNIPVKYFEALIFFLSVNLFFDFARIITVSVYLRKRKYRDETKDNFILGINRIASIINFVGLLLASFIILETDVFSVFASLSIVAAAIAILSKDYISNMINGMILMFSGQVSLNDQIKIGDYQGKITDINFMNIMLTTDDDDVIFVPNNTVMTSEVVNYTQRLSNRISIEFEIGYKFLGNVSQLETYIVQNMVEFDDLVQTGSYTLKTARILKESAIMKFQLVMIHDNKKLEVQIRRKVSRSIINYIYEKEEVAGR